MKSRLQHISYHINISTSNINNSNRTDKTHLGLDEANASGVSSTEDVADDVTPPPPAAVPEAKLDVGVSFPVGVCLSRVGGDTGSVTSAAECVTCDNKHCVLCSLSTAARQRESHHQQF